MRYFSFLLLAVCMSTLLSSCNQDAYFRLYSGEIMPYKELYCPVPSWMDPDFKLTEIYTRYRFKDKNGETSGFPSITGFDDKFREGYIYTVAIESIHIYDRPIQADATAKVYNRLSKMIHKEKAIGYELREFAIGPELYEKSPDMSYYQVTDRQTGHKMQVSTQCLGGFWHYFRPGNDYVIKVCCHPPLADVLPDTIDSDTDSGHEMWAVDIVSQTPATE